MNGITHKKQNILSEIVGEGLCALPITKLTPIGEAVKVSIKYIADNYGNISVDKFVIMPNHIHLIITQASLKLLRKSLIQRASVQRFVATVLTMFVKVLL